MSLGEWIFGVLFFGLLALVILGAIAWILDEAYKKDGVEGVLVTLIIAVICLGCGWYITNSIAVNRAVEIETVKTESICYLSGSNELLIQNEGKRYLAKLDKEIKFIEACNIEE